MKAKMSYKSKKIAIITAIILVLIAGIATGTYYFIKGNDETRAAYEENQELTQGNRGESETTQGQEEKPNTDEPSNQDENIQNDEDEGTNGTDNTTDNESNSSTTTENGTNSGTTTGNNQNTSNGNNSDAELPNEEYTQTDIIEREEERETQNLTVAWNNIDLSRAQMSTNINTNKPVLEINKVAKLNSLNENDNAVQEGSKITYEINVTNKSAEIDAKNVNISDIIPEGTKLVENSISNDGIVENEKISWTVDISRNSSVTVSFTVEVISTENDIKNVAVVDGKDTPETVNPVIETSKTVSSENSKLTELKEGSEIEYSIKVTNTSKEEQAIAKTTVKDTVPEGTTLVEGSITGSEKYVIEEVNGQKVITWNDIALNPEESKEFKFKVTINAFEGESKEIKNVALVGDTNTNEEKVTVYNPILSIDKSADPEKVAEGDTITYTITLKNDGKVDGLATIKDSIPADTSFTDGSIKINGETTTKTAGDLAQGIQVNVPAEDFVTLTFEVTVNSNSGLTENISNTAYLVDEKGNETPTNPTETKVEAKIVFVEKGGTPVAPIEGYAGDVIENTTMPTTTKTGYTFDGWYTDESYTTKVNELPGAMVAGTTYYYAKWNIRTDLSYTVNYLEKGTNKTLATAKVVENQTYGTSVTEKAIDITGYKKVKPTEVTITIDVKKNEINFYYEARKDLSYTVNYLEKGTDKALATAKVVENQTYGTSVTEKAIDITGYKKVAPMEATITIDVKKNEISFYYVKDESQKHELSYTVEYYKDGEKADTETVTKSVWVNDETLPVDVEKINVTDKYVGYKFVETNPTKIPTTIENGGVIKVYYVKDESQTKTLKYTVEYYLNDEPKDSEVVTEKVWINSERDSLTVNKENINTTNKFGDSAIFVKINPTTIPDTVKDGTIIKVYYKTKLEPSLTLTKTALNTDKDKITELTYYANNDNYMYYRLKVENTVKGSYPEIVTDEQTITDTLPLGMTAVELPSEVSKETVEVDGEKRTKITWKVSNIGYGEKAKQIDIKVKLDEKVFKGQEVDAGTETTVISDIEAEQVKDFNVGRREDRDNTMSMFVRFASPTSGNSGYLYAGTTKAANRNMPSGEAYVPGYNDNTINGNMNDEMALATMLDDFVTANNDGTMSKYTAYGLPTTADVKRFLENNYGISLTDNQVVLWYKVAIAEGETSRTRRYKITNNKTGEVTNKDIDMEECSYHIDGIIVDVRSLGEKIPDGASVNVVNTAKVENASNIWNKSTDSISTLIYYNTKQATTQTSNILSKALSKVEKEEINDENIDEVIEKIEKNEIKNEIVEEDKEETANSTENTAQENIVDKEENVESSTENKEETEVNEEDNILNNEVAQDNEIDLNNSEISVNEETIRNSENELKNDVIEDSLNVKNETIN